MNRQRLLQWSAGIFAVASLFTWTERARTQTQPATSTASTPTTTTAPAGRRGGGGRGPGRAFVPTPGMVQDSVTNQWYTPMKHSDYAFGADVSGTKQIEDRGKQFKDNGVAKPVLNILQDHGYNWVRLRVCVPQAQLPQTTEYTLAYAKEAKKLGYQWLLDFHYANGWADPRNEPIPREWANKSHDELVKLLSDYTRDTIAEFAKADCMPDIVQIGNEVSNGFCMPDAKLPEHWDMFGDLVNAGVKAVDAGRGDKKMPRIMIHVDHGGDIPKTKAFFDKLNTYNVPYDIIGFSFYPWSHGNLMDLRDTLAFTIKTYQKDVIVVETGYYYSPSQYFSKTPGPFPETPEGQAQWLDAVNKVVMAAPDNRGRGVFWWEPAAGQGLTARGYFDNAGNAQPVVNVFNPYTRPVHRTDDQ